MKKIIYIPLILSLTGILAILLSIVFSWQDWMNLISHSLALTGLLATAVTALLLRFSKGWIKYTGSLISWTGFLIWSMAVYHFIDLKFFWNIALSFIALGLITGIYARSVSKKTNLKWPFFIITAVMLIIFSGIILKVENSVFYACGSVVLIAFSIFSLTGTLFIRSKSTPE